MSPLPQHITALVYLCGCVRVFALYQSQPFLGGIVCVRVRFYMSEGVCVCGCIPSSGTLQGIIALECSWIDGWRVLTQGGGVTSLLLPSSLTYSVKWEHFAFDQTSGLNS